MDAAEQRVTAMVTVQSEPPGAPWMIELRHPAAESVSLGPYANPALAQADAERLRQFLAALLRQG